MFSSNFNSVSYVMWDTNNWGTVIATLSGAIILSVFSSVFSPDGPVLVSGS